MRDFSGNDQKLDLSILDDDDLHLLHALQIAPRASWTSLAPILNVHSTTLAARWNRLSAAGIAWVAAHPIDTPWCPVTAFIEVSCQMADQEAVIEALAKLPDVVSLDISARHRDLLLTVTAASLAHLTEATLPMITKIPGIVHVETSLSTRIHALADRWSIRSLNAEQIAKVEALNPRPRVGTAPRVRLDVLRELVKDGRRSAADIARALDISEATARRQIQAAIEYGIVRFRCELAQSVSGCPITAEWFAAVPAGDHHALAREVATLPGVRLCASTTGRSNIFITVWLKSVAEMPLIEARLSRAVPSIVFRESAIALRIVKRVGHILDPAGRSTGEAIPPSWGAPDHRLASHLIRESTGA